MHFVKVERHHEGILQNLIAVGMALKPYCATRGALHEPREQNNEQGCKARHLQHKYLVRGGDNATIIVLTKNCHFLNLGVIQLHIRKRSITVRIFS